VVYCNGREQIYWNILILYFSVDLYCLLPINLNQVDLSILVSGAHCC